MNESSPAPAAPATEVEKDVSTLASEEGFTGTLAAFLTWLRDSLVYGSLRITEGPDELKPNARVVIVETVTGGYSSDEHLLARVQRNILMGAHWSSSHRGGLTVYQFPKSWYESAEEYEFLAPENHVFERLHRARRIRVHSEHGDQFELNYSTGAELVFEEPDRDINEPDGVLVIRPIHPTLSMR